MSDLQPIQENDNIVNTCVIHYGGVKYCCDIDMVMCDRDTEVVGAWDGKVGRRISPFIEMEFEVSVNYVTDLDMSIDDSSHVVIVDENREFEYVIELMNVSEYMIDGQRYIDGAAIPIHQDHPFWSVNLMRENDDYDGLLAPDLDNENHIGITMKRVSPPRPSDYPDNGTYGESEQVETRIRTGSYSPNKHWPSKTDSDADSDSTEEDTTTYSYRCTMTDCTECVSIKSRHDVIRHECSSCGTITQFEIED